MLKIKNFFFYLKSNPIDFLKKVQENARSIRYYSWSVLSPALR